MACPVSERAGLAVAGYGAVDQSGMYFCKSFIGQPKTLHGPGTILFNHNIIALIADKTLDHLDTVFLFQVQSNGFFIAVQRGVHA